MSQIDWPGLLRAGLFELRLTPEVFWRLTPVELKIMLGAANTAPALTRARLEELARAFPDGRKAKADDGYRGPDGPDCSA
jgi:uncharacterized phage protein (TIGR02216 family)